MNLIIEQNENYVEFFDNFDLLNGLFVCSDHENVVIACHAFDHQRNFLSKIVHLKCFVCLVGGRMKHQGGICIFGSHVCPIHRTFSDRYLKKSLLFFSHVSVCFLYMRSHFDFLKAIFTEDSNYLKKHKCII
ncbi:hypothetical protein BpHYR1_045424 [Brachionus plicatilis]|uniref:Uncharacterized protein n=1 Tax=Brachionus plicatilis TaxID=10195 RepID=A0A3M7PK38_BRAPC|nr:hypothetical protein BpHYR1_045424 [Brachionus plicatilis]